MRRYAAFLRGVSPMNAKMPDLKRCFEEAGFAEVRTLLSSGNVVFAARPSPEASLERKAEKAMEGGLGRAFLTIVRPIEVLEEMIEADPFARFRLARGSKRVVTLLRSPPRSRLRLPIEVDGARILGVQDRAVFTAYVRSPKGPVFMTLIEKTFGAEVTTRTWETLTRVAKAGRG